MPKYDRKAHPDSGTDRPEHEAKAALDADESFLAACRACNPASADSRRGVVGNPVSIAAQT